MRLFGGGPIIQLLCQIQTSIVDYECASNPWHEPCLQTSIAVFFNHSI